jgi:hypothetical protein
MLMENLSGTLEIMEVNIQMNLNEKDYTIFDTVNLCNSRELISCTVAWFFHDFNNVKHILDVHESVHCDKIMKVTNKMQLYTLIYYS